MTGSSDSALHFRVHMTFGGGSAQITVLTSGEHRPTTCQSPTESVTALNANDGVALQGKTPICVRAHTL